MKIHPKPTLTQPSAAYIRQWMGPSLVHVMACRLFGPKPLPEPVLAYCQLNSWEKNHWNSNRNSIIFIQEIAFENVTCQDGDHFVQGNEFKPNLVKSHCNFHAVTSSCILTFVNRVQRFNGYSLQDFSSRWLSHLLWDIKPNQLTSSLALDGPDIIKWKHIIRVTRSRAAADRRTLLLKPGAQLDLASPYAVARTGRTESSMSLNYAKLCIELNYTGAAIGEM